MGRGGRVSGFRLVRNRWLDRVVRAGLVALDRDGTTVTLDDWNFAGQSGLRTPTSDERERLRRIAVSDEVVRLVARVASEPNRDDGPRNFARGPIRPAHAE